MCAYPVPYYNCFIWKRVDCHSTLHLAGIRYCIHSDIPHVFTDVLKVIIPFARDCAVCWVYLVARTILLSMKLVHFGRF